MNKIESLENSLYTAELRIAQLESGSVQMIDGIVARTRQESDKMKARIAALEAERDALSEKLAYAEDILNVLVAKGVIEKPTP